MWVTADGDIGQELLPDGRYGETRGIRRSAYTGRYTVTGSHLFYVDDTGFTATGDIRDGVLFHEHLDLYKTRLLLRRLRLLRQQVRPQGLLEAVGKEVTDFGIHVTAIEPGSFRTDWGGPLHDPCTADHPRLRRAVRAHPRRPPGQPARRPGQGCRRASAHPRGPGPPARLVLGSDARRLVRAGRAAVDRDLDTWKDLTLSTDHTSADAP